MARPTKDGHSINVYMDSVLYDNLTVFSNMSGKTKTTIIEEALQSFLMQYINPEGDGKIQAIPAVILRGNSDFERKVAENEGREVQITEVPCFVLSQTTIYNEPYYVVYDVNAHQRTKVPQAQIRFNK